VLVSIGDIDHLNKVKISFLVKDRKTISPFSSPNLVSLQNALIRLITKYIFLIYLFTRRVRNFPVLNSK
jgi:hypothetical protein